MQKQAINMGVCVLVAAAFTAFFKWIMNLTAFEVETGLMIPGKLWTKVAAVACIASLALVALLVRRLWYKNYYPAQTYDKLIVGDPYWVDRITKVIAAVMILGAGINFFIGSFSVYRNIQGVLSLLGVAAAVSFVKLSQLRLAEQQSPFYHTLWATVPVVFYVDWLTVSYRTNSANPAVWSYAPEIMVLALCIAATFYFAGYGWEFPRPYAALGCNLAAALVSLAVLMDDRNLGQRLMLVGGAGMMLYHAWMIICSMREEWPAAPEEQAEGKETEA